MITLTVGLIRYVIAVLFSNSCKGKRPSCWWKRKRAWQRWKRERKKMIAHQD